MDHPELALLDFRIREGYRADFTGFVDDPVQIDPDDLVELPVVLTVVEGRVVWRG